MQAARIAPFVTCALLCGCVMNGPSVSPLGHPVAVHTNYGAIDRGELLAATGDSVWLASPSRLSAYGATDIRQLRVRRHTMTLRSTLKWMGIAGLATGTALMIACNNYYTSEGQTGGGDCVGTIPGSLLVFGAGGLLFGWLNEMSSTRKVKPAELHLLRPYGRYPQGLPDTVRMLMALPRP